LKKARAPFGSQGTAWLVIKGNQFARRPAKIRVESDEFPEDLARKCHRTQSILPYQKIPSPHLNKLTI
jgi:hypothetical protein